MLSSYQIWAQLSILVTQYTVPAGWPWWSQDMCLQAGNIVASGGNIRNCMAAAVNEWHWLWFWATREGGILDIS